MTQPQAQQFAYSQRFSALLRQIDTRDEARMWSIALESKNLDKPD